MHEQTVDLNLERIEYNVQTLALLPYQYASRYFDESLDEMKFVKKAGEYLTSLFDQADQTQMRRGIVHLDLWYDNMNIQDDDTITLFDFDFCGNGWLVLDVAYFTLQLFNTEPDKKLYEQNLVPAVGLAIWLFYLGVQSRRFDNWSNIFLTENYLKHYIGLIKN